MPTQTLGKINTYEMYMHITLQDGSSSIKKKDLAFKASQEKRGKAKVDHDSSSDDEIDDASLALMSKKDKYKKKYKGKKDNSSDDDDKKKNKPYKKKDGKKKEYHNNKNGKAYIIGDWLTDIESSSCSSGDETSDELREENEIVSSKLNGLKTSKRELREKYDKLEGIHNELTTRYNLQKEEYTTLKVNHDNLVLSHEYLSNEPHDATNQVVKIDIATLCDDLNVESIEQGSSSKGKIVVEFNNYDNYIKVKNEKLKKDLEKLATTNTIVLETLDNDHHMALENEMLREENKRLKMVKNLERLSTHDELREENKKLKLEKEHLKTSLNKFTRGQYLQSELLMNTVIKMDRSGIGFLANQENKAKAQHQ
ncbi:tropomyosin-1-like [Miscanthus floridulus]|uniref:tropomyosin-1-like n=1 Tax=Miscanthus floridulus TaxID=154761 RepID=UPI0034592863